MNIKLLNDRNSNVHWELLGFHQEDPLLIKAIREKVIIYPPKDYKRSRSLKYPPIMDHLRGQYGQPLEVERTLKQKKLWKNKTGFFVEAGASGGEHLSNSIYFELKHSWTGLLVEPNPVFYESLFEIKRNAWILPHCLSTEKKVQLVDFDLASFNGGIVNKGRVLPSDLDRKNFTAKSSKNIIKV